MGEAVLLVKMKVAGLLSSEHFPSPFGEEHSLRVFENKVLRKIFGAKRDEVTGEWRKLHNAELHALYSSPDIIRNIKCKGLRWAGHVARMGKTRNAYRMLVGKPEGKRPLGKPRRRWEDNIKMDLREVGYDGRDWINLAQDRDQWRAYVRLEFHEDEVYYVHSYTERSQYLPPLMSCEPVRRAQTLCRPALEEVALKSCRAETGPALRPDDLLFGRMSNCTSDATNFTWIELMPKTGRIKLEFNMSENFCSGRNEIHLEVMENVTEEECNGTPIESSYLSEEECSRTGFEKHSLRTVRVRNGGNTTDVKRNVTFNMIYKGCYRVTVVDWNTLRKYRVCSPPKFIESNVSKENVFSVKRLTVVSEYVNNERVANILKQRIPNLTGPVDNNDVTLQRNRNKTAGRIDGFHGDCISCCLC
ncbi:hypothetical protein ANN_00261 [Periplaneta americana]|uniref:Uncharacterized protein n=1 Tax=Periplaneta americana TaxID=6978 RepID=A0ABQ8TQC7_PERAM|nr:hypothetical protein ANN_00261 [Periplaneta americana]